MEKFSAYVKTIPEELKALKQWGLFELRYDEKRGKNTKIPINPYDGTAGKSNNPSTWSDFKTALYALGKQERASGLAFYFANGYVGLDIDHIQDDLDIYWSGDPSSLIKQVQEMTDKTYMEISQSGEGIHAIFKGKIPGKRRRKGQFEMYESGRFFALTGNTITPGQVKSLDKPAMTKLYEFMFGKDNIQQLHPVTQQDSPAIDLDIHEILDRAYGSAQGPRIKLFMQGGWEKFYSSHSEADMAFANMLAFWTGRDYDKMDKIFRASSLIRDKWDEVHGATTYGKATLNKAINECPQIYNPKAQASDGYKVYFNFNKPKDGKDKPEDLPPRSWDDMGMAQRVLDHYGDCIKYLATDKDWYIYNGQYWEADNKGLIEQICDNVINSLDSEAINIPADATPDEEDKARKNWNKFKKHERSNKAKNDLIKELRHHVPVLHADFDKEDMALNTPSGWVDLTNGELHEHDINKMFTQITGSEYSENIDCPHWGEFLNETFEGDLELIHFIQKAVGYSLTGSNKEQVMFILNGNGRNGKSVFLDTIQPIFGFYAKTMNVSSLMVKYGQSANSDIARLEGTRFVVSSEANEGARLDEGLVKQLTGGDRVVARKLYGQEFEFEPKFKIWMATNHKPLIRGTDDGIWRRLVLIPFNHQVPLEKVDKSLKDKLLAESMGILKWAVDGCLIWQSEGLTLPKSIANAGNDYRNEMDVLSEFIADCCEVGPGEVSATALYENYASWATDSTEYKMSKRKFGIEMGKKFDKRKSHGNYVYTGITIRTDPRLAWNK